MNKAFQVHMLNDQGKNKARQISEAFDNCLTGIEAICAPDGRELAIVRTKMEEACFFAKKAMAQQPENQQEAE